MKTEWNATAKMHENGSCIFEKCDIEAYRTLAEEYEGFSKGEKAKYKGRDAYIEEKSGVSFSQLNLRYIRLMQEVKLRISNDKMPEILNIDPILDQRTVRDLLSSLENEEYIKKLYKDKKLNVTSGLNTTEALILLDCMLF